MVEQGWVASEVMQDHLENLMSLRFMTVVELVTRHMPEGPTSPMPAGDTSWHAWHRVDPYSMSDLGIELTLLPSPYVRTFEWVAKSMVLSKE
jgi:hypothetical protein